MSTFLLQEATVGRIRLQAFLQAKHLSASFTAFLKPALSLRPSKSSPTCTFTSLAATSIRTTCITSPSRPCPRPSRPLLHHHHRPTWPSLLNHSLCTLAHISSAPTHTRQSRIHARRPFVPAHRLCRPCIITTSSREDALISTQSPSRPPRRPKHTRLGPSISSITNLRITNCISACRTTRIRSLHPSHCLLAALHHGQRRRTPTTATHMLTTAYSRCRPIWTSAQCDPCLYLRSRHRQPHRHPHLQAPSRARTLRATSGLRSYGPRRTCPAHRKRARGRQRRIPRIISCRWTTLVAPPSHPDSHLSLGRCPTCVRARGISLSWSSHLFGYPCNPHLSISSTAAFVSSLVAVLCTHPCRTRLA